MTIVILMIIMVIKNMKIKVINKILKWILMISSTITGLWKLMKKTSLENQKLNELKRRSYDFFGLIAAVGAVTISGAGVGIYFVIKKNNTLYDANGNPLAYNKSSSATNWISHRTVSLLFQYAYSENSVTTPVLNSSSPYQAGTGWIYQADQSSNTFYIATNLHVANILSFIGKSNVQTVESNTRGTYFSYKNYADSVNAFVGITTSGSNNSKYSNDIVYFPVTTPTVTFTTTTDSEFKNKFNSTDKQYSGKTAGNSNTKYNGAQDIAVLKYQIDPSSLTTSGMMTNKSTNINQSTKNRYLNTFKDWISNYFENPTNIYSGNVEDLENLKNRNLYMAGFPSYNRSSGGQGSSLSDISWIAFSGFSTYGDIQFPAKAFVNGTDTQYLPVSLPIAFYNDSNNSDYKDYNYVSIGIQSMINASSYAGSSGSPIVIQDSNGSFQIAGIYWGEISSGTDSTFYKGLMTWFNTSAYKLSNSSTVSYSLTTQINSKINTN
ncbi:hypothetical protein D8X55_03010 [Malacoplasma penetrans]|uniref:Uncharacterized protein n=2 Tax=Malacoplasma penetrans TaxID=28227 RepID=Q8EUT2_MALP2|nr:hypothetical protein D8X55_03010 [Malacoplasma penetrans]BAC44630.1 conserved hypothetical protein [Malacoplasma penetrans HF-2]